MQISLKTEIRSLRSMVKAILNGLLVMQTVTEVVKIGALLRVTK